MILLLGERMIKVDPSIPLYLVVNDMCDIIPEFSYGIARRFAVSNCIKLHQSDLEMLGAYNVVHVVTASGRRHKASLSTVRTDYGIHCSSLSPVFPAKLSTVLRDFIILAKVESHWLMYYVE